MPITCHIRASASLKKRTFGAKTASCYQNRDTKEEEGANGSFSLLKGRGGAWTPFGIKRWEEAVGVGGRNLILVTFFGAEFTNKHLFSPKQKSFFKHYGETMFYTFLKFFLVKIKKSIGEFSIFRLHLKTRMRTRVSQSSFGWMKIVLYAMMIPRWDQEWITASFPSLLGPLAKNFFCCSVIYIFGGIK